MTMTESRPPHPSKLHITTCWGVELPVTGIRPEHMDIRGIAESLAKLPRWTGHTPGFFVSVADHSVWVSAVCEEIAGRQSPDDEEIRLAALAGLLHDGHETQQGDRATPIKTWERWRTGGIDTAGELAAGFDAALFEYAGVPWPLPLKIGEIVHHADLVLRATENRDFRPGISPDADLPPPLSRRLTPSATWMHGQEAFLARWTALTGRHG